MPQYSGIWTLSQVSQAVKNLTWTGNIPPSVVEYLVVAGAGGGGQNRGGGGGAGGLLAGYAGITSGASYFVTVGGGGTGGFFTGSIDPTNGSTSVFDSTTSGASTGRIVALGGGRAGSFTGTVTGASGGSGGGGGGDGTTSTGGAGASGQGSAGGTGTNFESTGGARVGGGGGGASSGGMNGISAAAGNGGMGIASSISGSPVAYAGGGGGGTSTSGASAGTGGVGGGGDGRTGGNTGRAGSVNSGGGAGGGGTNSDGGIGGSGIVIIRYPGTTQFFTGGTLSYGNGHVIHTFYANGVLAPTAPTLYVNPDYQISRSLRFNSADSAYLTRTPASATNQKTWTWSGWVKRGTLSSGQSLFSAQSTTTANLLYCYFSSTDKLTFYQYSSSGSVTDSFVDTTQVFRDTSAWYHIVVAVDTTQATAADRVKFYVNGVIASIVSGGTNFTQGTNTYLNATNPQNIARNPNGTQYFNGYMTDVNFIDGVALTPSSFGWINPTTGVWAPLDFVGSYGTNGYNLTFSDNTNTTAATLGADSSGNGNNWTPNNFSVTAGAGNDSLVDSPTLYGTDTGVGGEVRGNYGTWNPLTFYSTTYPPTLTNGNLDASVPAQAGLPVALGTLVMPSGQWYWEVTITAGGAQMVGIADSTAGGANSNYTTANGWYYYSGGQRYTNNVPVSYGATFTVNDVIGIAVDIDAGTLVFYKNGASQGTAYSTGLTGKTFVAALGNGSGAVVQSYTGNFGQRAFAYTAPSGFKALNTQNLPTPTIGATSATLAGKYFNTVLWTGNNVANRAIAGVGFQPDWTWLKARSYGAQFHNIVDSVRGATSSVMNTLYTNETFAEVTTNSGNYTTYGYIKSLDSDGFTVTSGTQGAPTYGFAQVNWNGEGYGGPVTYAAWNWKAGGTAVTNTSGSITSSVSASPTSGFSVVTYTGTGVTASVGHGLGALPQMIIVKRRNSTSDWAVYHRTLGANTYLVLNSTAAAAAISGYWQYTPSPGNPTVDWFGIIAGYDVNVSSATYVAYCFAAIAGYSAFGSYTGNGSTDGPFVYTGFRPAWIMIKTSSVASQDWYILDSARDTYNLTANKLFPNTTGVENASPNSSSTNALDFLSNGFKLKTTNDGTNQSAGTYVYMAFASNPFKYSLAR